MTLAPTPRKLNFTKAAIEALPITDKRVFYYDTAERGLAVLVEPTGRKTFYLYRKVRHTTTQLKLGVFPDMPVPLARDRARVLNVAIAAGEDPGRARAGKRGELTLAEMFVWYIDTWAKTRKRTWRENEKEFIRHFGPLAGRPFGAITRQDVRKWHGDLLANNGYGSANNCLKLLSSIYGRAIALDKWEGVNPCASVAKVPEVARDRRLRPDEIADFFDALAADRDPDIRDYIHLSLFTGQRKGSILAMRWDDIDMVGRMWRIPMTKNGRPQYVPLEDEEIAILERRKEAGGEWVFPGRGTKGHLVDPKKAWRRILKRANAERAKRNEPPLTDLRIHDLRRTLGSFMADTGASLQIIGKTLGHTNQATTAIYARLSLDPVRQAKRAAIDAMRPRAGES